MHYTRFIIGWASAVGLLSLKSMAFSQSLKQTIVILTPQEYLAEKEKWVVLDARDSGFEEGHLPQAQPWPWHKLRESSSWDWIKVKDRNQYKGFVSKNKREIESELTQLGLGEGKGVLIYGSPKQFGTESRVAWNFLYWGVKRVGLLDGGWERWKKEGLPISNQKNLPASPGKPFEVRFQEERRMVSETLLNQYQKIDVFDARTLPEYEGKSIHGERTGGRIPGAKHLDYKSLYDHDGNFLSKSDFLKRLGSFSLGPTVVSYCTGGVRSSLLVILYEYYTGKIMKNYDGSMWEWSSLPNAPLQ